MNYLFIFQSNLDWLLELMGHIRSHLRQEVPSKLKTQIGNKSKTQNDGFLFLFDVFNLAVIAFSELENVVTSGDLCKYKCRTERLSLLPLATARLLDHEQVNCFHSLPLTMLLFQNNNFLFLFIPIPFNQLKNKYSAILEQNGTQIENTN